MNFALPLGISFVTFTLIAYLVDVSDRQIPGSQASPRWLLGYTLFFPHLIAGPILRPHELIPQLQPADADPTAATCCRALRCSPSGLIKKMVFADPIGDGGYGDLRYSRTDAAPPISVRALRVLGPNLFRLLRLFRHGAGRGLVLGIRLPRNFQLALSGASIADFWRRWHITLSHWLRDYVYIPLGGNRGGGAPLRNLVLTMTIAGIWHGAGWSFFIAWGFLHGAWRRASYSSRHAPRVDPRPPRWVSVLVTFHVVALLWVLFRAPDLTTAFTVLQGLSRAELPSRTPPTSSRGHLFEGALILAFFLTHPWDDGRRIRIMARTLPPVVVGAIILMGFVLVIAIGAESPAQFIYFEF